MKNRQPLSEMIIASVRNLHLTNEMIELIKDELNILKVEFKKDAKEFLNYNVKPNLKTLGPKFGKGINEIRNYLQNCDNTEVGQTALEKGEVTLELASGAVKVLKDDLLIEPISKPGFVSESANGITAILDTTLTDKLVELGNVRELVSKIQAQRKEADFDVSDHITIYISASKEFSDFAEKYKAEIMKDTLAGQLVLGTVQGFAKENDINGELITLGVERK